MNSVVLIGRLTREPEYSATEDWTPVCTFHLAVNREYRDANGKRPADFSGLWHGAILPILSASIAIAATEWRCTGARRRMHGKTITEKRS